ncbi:MAG TPA: glycosyltransferase [Gaiellales bacterium]|jgi:D-inositol-3-phosphate glycosyltransferase|nr:glycosyltransferase [Gaiellales bacterium]
MGDEELRGEYTRARVMAYLARSEPFGLAALEAQACGCPVVTSAEGGLQETIVEGVTGFAVPRDADAAARAFDALCEPDLAARAQAAAAEHGRGWSWDTSAAQVRVLLAEQAQNA